MDKIFTCEEVAKRYQVKLRTVWEWARTGVIPVINIGKFYRFREADLLAFEEKNLIGAESKE